MCLLIECHRVVLCGKFQPEHILHVPCMCVVYYHVLFKQGKRYVKITMLRVVNIEYSYHVHHVLSRASSQNKLADLLIIIII